MRKDLIVIGSYCPDDERIQLLNECIDHLSETKDDFDIMISSHSLIPDYILKKVDYCFYFKKNELIIDWEYMNKPWFSPMDNLVIESCFVTNQSTYLAVYGVFLTSLGIAKSLNYKTVHYIEYDSKITDFSDLYENSKIIEDFVAINYKKKFREFESNLDWGYGCFQTINIDKLPKNMLKYDREYLLDLLRNSASKTNEKITQDLFLSEGGEIYYKDFDKLILKGNQLNLSVNTEKDSMDYWTVPFWDGKSNNVKFIVWNNKGYENIDVIVILNDEKTIIFKKIPKFGWNIQEIGLLQDIETITIFINGKFKNKIIFNDELREKFKISSYAVYK